MLQFQSKIDLSGAFRTLDLAQKQVRYAAMVALTRTASKARQETQREMATAFDRPTRYTINSVRFKPATKESLSAWLYISGDTFDKNPFSPAEQLGHQFAGGGRNVKRMEKRLQMAGFLSAGEFVVPGAGAKLDAYGNMSKGQIQQILSQIKATGDAATYASKSKRSTAKRKNNRIFWSRGGNLARGAWIDQGPAAGIKPLLLVISAPTYRRRMFLDKVVARAVQREFSAQFKTAYEQAMRTAR